jgi:hypothetical protein
MQRVRLAATAVLVGIAAVAGMIASPPVSGAPGRDEAIADLLDRRAAAVRDRDRDAFLATVSPLASDVFRARQAAWFDHLAEIPLASYTLVARWDIFGDLARDRERKRYGPAEEVAVPLTQERLALSGFDESPAVEDLYLTFVLHNGEWGITSDADLEDLGLLSARRLWDFAPVDVRRSKHFLLLEHPGAGAPPGTVSLAEDAIQRVDRYWGGSWRRRVPIVAPATEAELQRMLQLTVDLSDFVAFAYATLDDRRGDVFTGTRIVLNPDAIAGRSRSATFDVLAHEMAHAASRPRSGPLTPLWVEEGLAEQVRFGGSNAGGPLAGAPATGRLPVDASFQYGAVGAILQSYEDAYSAVGFFIDRFGLHRFRRFYAELGRAGRGFGTQRYHLDETLRSVVGMSLEQFERAWASSIGTS